jgi:hypothetical protein
MTAAPADIEKLEHSLAYCGLVCALCFRAHECDGCKSANNRCERNCSDEGCFQRECCTKAGRDGCWECGDLSTCTEGIYAQGSMSKIKAFALFVQAHGKRALVQAISANQRRGWSVEKGRDYDGKPIPEVLAMLAQGLPAHDSPT